MTPDFLNDKRHGHQDEVIQEVRANREDYAARFGYDVRAILRRARERARETGAMKREPRRIPAPGPN
jgi:hypothetical protein